MKYALALLCAAALLRGQSDLPALSSLGTFENQCDVGRPAAAGSASYDGGSGYVVRAAGANLWGKKDQFHYVWRKVSGDFAISATVVFPKPGEAPDRKAGLMVRAGLESDAPYVDALVHGTGLPALQFRDAAGADSHGIRFPVTGPVRIRLARVGNWYTMWAAQEGQPLEELGAYSVKLPDPVYLGLVVCSHRANFVDTADFSDVVYQAIPKGQDAPPTTGPLPIVGLANVCIEVSDLDAACAFYGKMLGLDEAFDTKDGAGHTAAAFFKVNDRQFVVVRPGKRAWQTIWHFALRTDDIGKLRGLLLDRGFEPTPIERREDGNLSFRLPHPAGQQMDYVEFLQYRPGSLSEQTTGRFLGPRRLSDHLEHVGIIATDYDAAYRFYREGLGFQDRYLRYLNDRKRVALDQLTIGGPKLEFVELFNETGAPLPVARATARGAVHFALTVPDDLATLQEMVKRGVSGRHPPPRFAWDNRYNVNIFDPDGTRVEFMQPEDPQRPTPLVVYTPATGSAPAAGRAGRVRSP